MSGARPRPKEMGDSLRRDIVYLTGVLAFLALAININMSPEATYKLKDFTPITALATVPTALVIIPSVPANNLSEFIALAKSKPDAMSYGSAGAGSIHHLTMEIFAERTGIKLLHVPYRGGSALVNGLLTGE